MRVARYLARPNRRLARGLAAATFATSLAVFGAPVEPCGGAAEHWLAVAFEGDFAPSFRKLALKQLATGLARQGLLACQLGARDDAPLAAVKLRSSGDALATVTITVDDQVTNKQVSRLVELRSLTESERALAFAVAAEELVRASWAELVLEREQEGPPAAPPPEALAVVERKLLPRLKKPRGMTQVVSGFSADYFPRTGTPWLGLELGLRRSGSVLRGNFVLQAHSSGKRGTEGGSIRLDAGGAQVELAAVLRPSSALRVSFGPSVEVLLVRATSNVEVPYRGAEVTDFVVIPRAALAFEFEVGSGLCLGVRAAAGHTVHGLALQASGETVSGPAGMVVGSAFTLGATL